MPLLYNKTFERLQQELRAFIWWMKNLSNKFLVFTPTKIKGFVGNKNILDRFSSNKRLQVLVAISQKFCCREKAWAMQELFIKKERKELKKWTSVRIIKTMGTQMPA